MLDEGAPTITPSASLAGQEDFLSAHIRLAMSYMSSPRGQHALGEANGHLPTALNRSPQDRSRAAWGIIHALHLLVEEDQLNTMAPEHASPGRANIRAILCQIGRWLRWHEFAALLELGVQIDLDPRNDQGKPSQPHLLSAHMLTISQST